MDIERNDPLADIFEDPTSGEEIGMDAAAVDSVGLAHPDALDLESILAEDWDSVPVQVEPEMTPEEALNQFLYGEDERIEDTGAEVESPVEDFSGAAPTQVIPTTSEEPEVSDDPTAEVPAVAAEEADFAETALVPDEEYAEVVEYEEEEEDMSDAPIRKSRPKPKKGYGLLGIPHILVTAVWLAITVMIGVSLGRVLWVCCADMMSFGKPPVTAYVTVTEEDDIESISQKLADANLIRYPGLFQKFAEITDKDDRIQTGIHELGSHLDYNAMINNMVYAGPARAEVKVTFPEGYTCAQMFKLLEENEVCTVAELEEWAANGELKEYWFLEGVPRGSKYCLEGYLSPDTYQFYTQSDAKTVLEKLLNAFDARFTDIMKEDMATMQDRYAKLLAKNGHSSAYISDNKLTLHQILTVASVVERETANDAESYEIAAVFYNRVANPNVGTMGSDATVYYAIGDFLREKKELSKQDLASSSPYNTRKATGFPPGPICNPGAYALYAALDPNDNAYLYFVYDKANNQHLFAKTYSEHQKNVKSVG